MKTNQYYGGDPDLVCNHHNMILLKSAKVPAKHIKFGDNHLVNCNLCGAFCPKSGSSVIRTK